jgi:hypothetical protein
MDTAQRVASLLAIGGVALPCEIAADIAAVARLAEWPKLTATRPLPLFQHPASLRNYV